MGLGIDLLILVVLLVNPIGVQLISGVRIGAVRTGVALAVVI